MKIIPALAVMLIILCAPAHSQTKNILPTGLAGIEYPCDGKLKRIPADILGTEYRGQCIDGIEVWCWSDLTTGLGRAKNTLFILVLNRTSDTIDVLRNDFYLWHFDAKHPDNPNKVSTISTIDPLKVVQKLERLNRPVYSQPYPKTSRSDVYGADGKYLGSVLSTDPLWPLAEALRRQQEQAMADRNTQTISQMTSWILRTAYQGSSVSSGGILSGFLYFGEVKGVQPSLSYASSGWLSQNKAISVPLGSWPVEKPGLFGDGK